MSDTQQFVLAIEDSTEGFTITRGEINSKDKEEIFSSTSYMLCQQKMQSLLSVLTSSGFFQCVPVPKKVCTNYPNLSFSVLEFTKKELLRLP